MTIEQNSPPRAVIYARISLADKGDTDGVDRQIAACRALAKAKGWELVGEPEVDNSVSASTGRERPAWERVKAALRERRADYAIAWHFDRITRTMLDLEDLIKLCEASGAGIAFVQGDLDLTTQPGRLNARILAAVARAEVETKSARQKAANHQKRERGGRFWARRPFGYEWDGTLHETEAPLLRQAYADVLDGASIHGIARRWELAGITSTTGKPPIASTVRGLLLHPRNIGKQTYRGEELPTRGEWDVLIDERTFRAVQRLLTAPGRRQTKSTKRTALLTGIMVCGACGGAMTSFAQHQAGKRYDYMSCRAKHNAWPRQWLEDHVTQTALAVLSDQALTEKAKGKPEPTEDAGELEREAEGLRNLIGELMEDRLDGVLSRAQWAEAHQGAQERLGAVEARLKALDGTGGHAPVLDLPLRERVAYWESLDTDGKRNLLLELFGKITAQPRGRGSRSEPDRNLLTFDRLNVANTLGLRRIV